MRPSAVAAVLLLFLTAPLASPSRAADAENGEKVFKRYCMTCHITAAKGPSRQGPTLFGIMGRHSGISLFLSTRAGPRKGTASPGT